MRRNEVLSLTRTSVDWQNRIANVAMTKNGKSAAVPLNDIAISALQSLPTRLDGSRMIPLSASATSIAFRRAVKRAGIANFKLHDLRHCFASYQAMAGVQSLGLQAMLRHSDPRMTSLYAHLSNQYLRDAVDRVQIGGGQLTKADKAG
jgi:integrase